MYTSYIGKIFLKLYNEKENKKLSARQFFDEIMFPLFFDNEKHLMHVSNSPFFQKPSKKDLSGLSKSQIQLKNLHTNIAKGNPNMAIYVGYAAMGIGETTSGQVTDINYYIDGEEMYLSWIGEALAIGVKGGYEILLDIEEVIWGLYLGWSYYRKYLSQTPNIKDNQIETWNGHWLCHILNNPNETNDLSEGLKIESTEVKGNLAIPTQKWSQLIFSFF